MNAFASAPRCPAVAPAARGLVALRYSMAAALLVLSHPRRPCTPKSSRSVVKLGADCIAPVSVLAPKLTACTIAGTKLRNLVPERSSVRWGDRAWRATLRSREIALQYEPGAVARKNRAAPPSHPIVASLTASAHARSYSSRLIHSSTVCASFWPAPKVTVGMPWRTIQLASSPPLVVRMFGVAAAGRHRRGRALHDRQRVLHAERMIVGLHLELDRGRTCPRVFFTFFAAFSNAAL